MARVFAVRVVTHEDWRLWRELRLAALTEAPAAFGSTLAQWSGTGDTEDRWRARLVGVALNLVILADGEPVAMVSGSAPGTSGGVELISLGRAVGAGYRRRRRRRGRGRAPGAGVARDQHPGRPVVLSVRADNQPARRLHERHGFVDAGPSPDDDGERLMRRPV